MRPLGPCLVPIMCPLLVAQEQPQTTRYIDPAQLDLVGPEHSFVEVPWRDFPETKPGHDFTGLILD